jgi:hypothetical protein
MPVIRYKSIINGAASRFAPSLRASGHGTDGAFSDEGNYAIFMRYLIALGQLGVSFDNKVVVEFGPGSSFGIGIAALLSGVNRYHAYRPDRSHLGLGAILRDRRS